MNATLDLIGAAEAAEILDLDRSMVTRLVASGDLPAASKLPGRTGSYLFARADVEALAEARRATKTTPAEGAAFPDPQRALGGGSSSAPAA